MAASRTDAPEALRAEALSKAYGARRALQDVSFSAAPGELLAIIGPNGAGKTTLLQILAGALAPTTGSVSLDRREVGWVPQQPAIYSKLSVRENLRLFARLEKVADVDGAVDRMLEQAGLRDRAGDAVGTLSGGNQQRVNVAVGLLGDPTVLLLDEPSSSLDPRQRERLWEFVSALARDSGTTVVYSTHNVAEAERYADRLLVLADGELLFSGTPEELERATGRARRDRFRGRVRALPASQGPLSVRWLLLKDLQILRRSPLLVALLVLYPIVVALLVGAALSSGPSKPKVAFANLVPADEAKIDLGGQRLDATTYASELFDAVDPIRVDSREEAIEKVRSGEALGALVIPPDVIERLQGTLALGGGEPPDGRGLLQRREPAQAALRRGHDRRDAGRREQGALGRDLQGGGALPEPDRGRRLAVAAARRRRRHPRAAQRADDHRRRRSRGLPEDSSSRVALQQVARFARLAADNLDVSKPILASIGSPVAVDKKVISGSSSSLDVFGVEVAVVISLMFVTLLLAAGMLALEREEHAFGRLVRGLVSRTGLLAEKIGLAGLCAWALAAVMMAVLVAFLDLGWGRTPLWLLALAFAALAFAALGVAIGGLAREVRAASLLAFMLALPVAALALVPSGAVGETLYDVIRIVSAAFPFKPALNALDAALSGGELLAPLAHLAGLTVGFALIARLALRRFA